MIRSLVTLGWRWLNCQTGNHRWVVYRNTHPTAILGGWSVHCGDCGHQE